MTNVKTAGLGSIVAGAVLAVAACGTDDGGDGDAFPTGTVEIIVPAAAGGSTDSAARLLAPAMEEALGTSVVVVNREGGSGATGANAVASADADGHTLLFTGDGIMLRSLVDDTPHSMDDFTSVGGYMQSPYTIVVSSDSDWQSVDDLKGEQFEYGASGVATLPQTMIASFLDMAGADATNVPFDGSLPALQGLLGNDVKMAIGEIQIAEQHIESGDLKALTVSSPERVEALPEVPTMEELGFEDSIFNVSWGLIAPAGTPEEAVTALNEAMQEAASSTESEEFLDNGGFQRLEGDAAADWLAAIRAKGDRYVEEVERLGLIEN